MLYPASGPTFYGEDINGLRSRFETAYLEAATINQAMWNEGHLNNRFYCNDATLWNGFYYGGSNWPSNQRQFNFGLVRSIINMIEGTQRRNRKTMIATPIENADQITADQITKVMMWVANNDNMYETISQAFSNACISGISFLKLWIDYRKDPVSGNLRLDACAYNSTILDPYWRKPDFSDCNYVIHRSYITQREAVSLMPDQADRILGMTMGANMGPRDGKFYMQPESFNYTYKNLLTYDEMYYRDFRNQKLLVDINTGETVEWKGQEDEELSEFLFRNPEINLIETTIPTVKLGILLNGNPFYDGPNPLGIDDYNIIPVLSYYQPNIPEYNLRIQSVVTNLRDPQFLFNRFILIVSDIFESQINSGWKYKEDALVNPLDVFLNGQGKGLALKRSAQMTDVEKIQPAEAPQSMFQLIDVFKDLLYRASNVSEENMGQNVQDIAGYLSMLRMSAGLTGLAPLLDQLDLAQKIVGKRIIDIVQTNFAPGKVKKILEGDEPSDWFYRKSFGEYHCVVEEGLLTSTQRQMQYAQMQDLFEKGAITKEDLLDAATIQNKTRIMENAQKQSEQVAQQTQQRSAIEMKELEARIEVAHSTARANEGLYRERDSRVLENIGISEERIADAHKADAAAELDRIKVLKELQSIDLGHLRELVEISRMLKEQDRQNFSELQAKKDVLNQKENKMEQNEMPKMQALQEA